MVNTQFFKSLDPFFVGFEDMFNRISMFTDATERPNYPPCNIRSTDQKNQYIIELAIAGFAREDIDITLEENKLVIKGRQKEEAQHFLYKGIASRDFTRVYHLSDQIVVKDAELINGILKVYLERIVPESQKPKQIPVRVSQTPQALPKSEPQYLTEDKNVIKSSKASSETVEVRNRS